MSGRKTRAALWIAVIAAAMMIFCFSAQTGDSTEQTDQPFTLFFVRLTDLHWDARTPAEQAAVLDYARLLVRKLAHLCEYALLGCLIRLLTESYRLRRASAWALLAGTLYAASDEVHQALVPGRTGAPQDVVLDALGLTAGIVLAVLLLTLRDKRRNRA